MNWLLERFREPIIETRHWSSIITQVAHAGAGGTIVEIGALVGDDTQALGQFGASVIALDIDAPAIRAGKRVGNISRGMAADMTSIGLDDESVDHVFFANSILFSDPKQGFSEAYRVLRRGGGLTVCTNSFPRSPIPHLKDSTMLRSAEHQGFSIVRHQIVEIPEKNGIRGDRPFLLFTGKKK